MDSTFIWILLTLSGAYMVYSQSDTSGLQATIPQNLINCYRNMSLLTREYLPPMTLNSLLAIIRKLENTPGVYLDMRTLSTQIMNSYRMDGIEKNPDVAPSQYVTPFGPSGNQFYRYKILMDGLIPTSGNTFSDTALRSEEKCAIHMMLSASVDRNERGDESTVCNSLTNYVRWDSRVPRNSGGGRTPRDTRSYKEEVEELEPLTDNGPRLGQWLEGGFLGLSCPLENGVVYTRYGAIKMGLVLGGIAAGLQSQSVSRRNLILVAKANSLRGRQFNFPRLYTTDTNPNISNIWAATLSGEVAEVALLQGPLRNSQMRVGLNGGWNDSVLPRYYFLNEDNKDAMTDTDIRGSIDGLILGSNAQTWSNQMGGAGRMKLSQLLDMYYSERGVLNSNVRACQRITQFNSMFTPDQIFQQSYAFSGVLELELPPAVNVEDAGLQTFNSMAVQKLISYVATMQDNQCSFGSNHVHKSGSPSLKNRDPWCQSVLGY
ncbi:uncharacterized protein LOC124362633 [Homalodisca vitripennis]|uniref:uncharacterized protein LOC124362633 n=1 Tax=Homalodisca vitripennis TaxID=197043 RepID=UPI001EE9EBAB|nr:uncharacterized protein LOC124362633 [Homalodisca vitripennis]